MILINKDSLKFTKVCPVDDPKNEQLAVLATDINGGVIYEVVKSIGGVNLPVDTITESKPVADHKMSVEDALIVGRSLRGLSGVEMEAIEVLCDYIENQND